MQSVIAISATSASSIQKTNSAFFPIKRALTRIAFCGPGIKSTENCFVLHRLSPLYVAACTAALLISPVFGQAPADPAPTPSVAQPSGSHILGLIPNFRTIQEMKQYQPIDTKEKFHIATQDSFDRGTLGLAAIFAGQSQLSNSNPSFGQGTAGYAKYLATAWGDFVIGDYLTEGVYPTLFHQDPRFFRRGEGGTLSRLGYAAGQIFLTHGDSGHRQFNFSEVVGNATGVAISNAYYRDNRTASDAVSRFGVQLGVDMASNVLKEFWPDIEHHFRRKHNADPASQH